MLANSFWWIPLAAGLADALNPCVLIDCVVFFVLAGWFGHRQLPRFKLLLVFLCVLNFLAAAFNTGFAQGILYAPQTRNIIHAVYVFLGFVSLAVGFILLNDRFQLMRGRSSALISQRWWQKGNCPVGIVWILVIVLAVGLAILGSIWPMNYYMGMIANNGLMPNQGAVTILLISIYTAVTLLPVYLIWLVMRFQQTRVGLFYTVGAAISISAGVGAIYIFK